MCLNPSVFNREVPFIEPVMLQFSLVDLNLDMDSLGSCRNAPIARHLGALCSKRKANFRH